jgi:hypothetical protein
MVWPSLKFVTLGLAALGGLVNGELGLGRPNVFAHIPNAAHPGEVDEFIHPTDVSRRQVQSSSCMLSQPGD